MLGGVSVLAVLAILFFNDPISNDDGNYAATVYWTKNTGFTIKYWGQGNDPDFVKTGVARAYYRPNMSKTGWATLEIQTQASYPDWIQAHAAGMLEGSLCWQLIYWHYINSVLYFCEGHEQFCNIIRTFLRKNSEETRQMAKKLDHIDPFWHQINLFYYQLDGLEIGWNYGVTRSRKNKQIKITDIDFLWLNAVCDIRDLELKYNMSKELNPFAPLSITLLKLLPKTTEKFVLAHASAGYYTEMLRVQKKYSFAFHHTSSGSSGLVPGQRMKFTSYPAALHSQDDFYHISGIDDLIIAGTSIREHSATVWNKTDVKQVLMGLRVLAANRLSKTAKEWANHMSNSNSGTGNKQWIVINPKQTKMDLWVIEQVPGMSYARNETYKFQKHGYWACYGLPFYDKISGVTDYNKNEIDIFTTVGNILHEGQKNVTDVESMIRLMRGPDLTIVGRRDLKSDLLAGRMNVTISENVRQALSRNTVSSKVQAQTYEKKLKTLLKHHSNNNFDNSQEVLNIEKNPTKFYNKLKALLGTDQEIEIADVDSDEDDKSSEEEEDSLTELGKNNKIITENLSGNIDLKMSTAINYMRAAAGPPFTENDEIEPFQWSKSSFPNIAHYGQLDMWNFDPVEMKWVW